MGLTGRHTSSLPRCLAANLDSPTLCHALQVVRDHHQCRRLDGRLAALAAASSAALAAASSAALAAASSGSIIRAYLCGCGDNG